MKVRTAVILVALLVLTLTVVASANVTVGYATTTFGPQTFQGDSFALNGQSGTLSLSTVTTTTSDINGAVFLVGYSAVAYASEALTVSYDLTLDGVTHTLSQPATWSVTPSIDTFTAAAGSPVLFVTPSGTWLVALDAYSIPATNIGTFTQSTAADFVPVPEPSSLLLLGLPSIAVAWRRYRG